MRMISVGISLTCFYTFALIFVVIPSARPVLEMGVLGIIMIAPLALSPLNMLCITRDFDSIGMKLILVALTLAPLLGLFLISKGKKKSGRAFIIAGAIGMLPTSIFTLIGVLLTIKADASRAGTPRI